MDEMDDLTKGTWIVNSSKHLLNLRTNTLELSYFEATELSGKAGMLLARLVADEQEIVPASKVRAFARESGITRGEILTCLNELRQVGKVDFAVDESNVPEDVEVYSFSLQDALSTTSGIYDRLKPSDYEQASLVSLDSTFHVPCFRSELMEGITSEGFSEKVADMTIKLQDTLELVRSSRRSKEPIFYNEYAFADDNAEKIAKALRGLSDSERGAVEYIQELVAEKPGYPLDALLEDNPTRILRMMEGVGLLDALTVRSNVGEATFVTIPQLKGISLDTPLLSADVFHKAKVLLSCLRFGEVKSQPWRGKIETHEKMVNIVSKLVRGEWVGPATAIGYDYQLLERDGVVTTRPFKSGMYEMKLRQKEVGLLVQQMLEFNRVFPEVDIELQELLGKQPTNYTTPEQRRYEISAKPTKAVEEIREKLLQELRTGMR